jgi:hypothetical protein
MVVHSIPARNHDDELALLTQRQREVLAHGRLKPKANQVRGPLVRARKRLLVPPFHPAR